MSVYGGGEASHRGDCRGGCVILASVQINDR